MDAPLAPKTIQESGIDAVVLRDLALKLAYTLPSFSTQVASEKLCLIEQIVGDLLDELKEEKLIEVLGADGVFGYRYTITGPGRERALRLLEVSGYVGPAPVSPAEYSRFLAKQFEQLPEVTPQQVHSALEDLELTDQAIEIAGLASSSRRTLFLYGPPGNGKTSVGRLLHNAVEGELWVPHCMGIDSNIIRVFDPLVHRLAGSGDESAQTDQRWVRVKRPFVVVGGELTLEALDLVYSPTHRYYEAPLHLKANGGTFLLDDFGCQRTEPNDLLSRWIYPLEHRIDQLTLQNGQKLEVPFQQMLIVSTNLDPESVMDPAFLRRMGYRLYVGDPTPAMYERIFRRYAGQFNLTVDEAVLQKLVERYAKERRNMHGCEPRDLINRARDIAAYRGEPTALSESVLELAWTGYFGDVLRAKSA